MVAHVKLPSQAIGAHIFRFARLFRSILRLDRLVAARTPRVMQRSATCE